MKILFIFCALLLTIQLLYPFVTVLLSRIISRPSPKMANGQASDYRFACIITAYRNAAIAQPLVESLLRQSHPNLGVYLVADECPEMEFQVEDERYCLLRPPEPLRLKVKSILYAVARLRRDYDYILVLDADNLVHPAFLAQLIPYLQLGYNCVQGQRCAKNLDSNYAALDSLGEHYKNFIEREVPFRLGASAVISGSGMATAAGLYKRYLYSPEIETGKLQWKKMLQEDKILQNFLLRQNEHIAYAREALVFDEKVETGEAVETQRSRWLFSYFQNIPNAIGILRRGLLGFNFNQAYFGMVTLALPMFLQLGLAVIMVVLGWFIAPFWSMVLLIALTIFSLNILWVLQLDAAPPEVWRVLWQVPKFMLRQMAGLLKMRDPNKHFKHTTHGKVLTVEEVLAKQKDKAP